MNETQKTNKLRGKSFLDQYFSGKIIDIGAGEDLVCQGAERFDIEDGDANIITKYRPLESYDTVHSSHCLEHMHNPKSALHEWWKLVKPNGYFIIVVPDEDLYEQGFWPSIFNSDHKNTFRLRKKYSWSPVSHDIEELIMSLPNVELVSAEIQDLHYDYSLQFRHGMAIGKEPRLPRFLRRKLLQLLPRFFAKLRRRLENIPFKHYNVPIDQTWREAVAQIQIVAKKGTSGNE